MSEVVVVVERGRRSTTRGTPARASVIDSLDGVRGAAAEARAVWVAPTAGDLALFGEISRQAPARGDHRLVVTDRVGRGLIEVLRATFRFVISADPPLSLLPTDQLIDVVSSPNRHEQLIGVAIDAEGGSLVFYRGSLEPIVVPASFFDERSTGPIDLSDIEVTDYGQAIRFGEREASVDAILYAFDPAHRRRRKAQLVERDPSFGGALRRLRILRGLSRNDFAGLSPREVARIERGEVRRPHAGTVRLLAQRLGVAPEEIASY